MDRWLKVSKRVEEPSTGTGSVPRILSQIWPNRQRVLIVNQDEETREVVRRMFSLLGYNTATACSGYEGLRLFFHRPCDLVLTDLRTEGISGWALASRIKRKYPNTPVVLMTTQDDREILGKIEGSAVDLVIFKPLGFKDLQRAVHDMLRPGRSDL